MKRIFLFLCIGLFIAGLFSCTSSAVLPYASEEIGGSSVWKVTKGGNTLYLGGSIHLLRESDFPLPVEFDLAFSLSEILVLEADVEQMGNPEIIQYLLSKMFLPDDLTLRSVLEPQTYELLSAAFLEYYMPLEIYARFKPSMVVSVLSLMQMQRLGFVEQGVDDYYLAKAKENNMQILFLESVESQIDIIVSMGDGYENEYVLYSLYDMDSVEEALDILVEDWRRGDRDITELSVLEMKESWPAIYKSLITNRHDEWMPQIKNFLNSGKVYFIIAGNAHMHGPYDLINLLEEYGCKVEQLKVRP